MKLTDLFFIEYPKTLIFADMIPQKDGINFISSQDKNNGVVAKVQECEGIKKYPAGIITVPLKGSVLPECTFIVGGHEIRQTYILPCSGFPCCTQSPKSGLFWPGKANLMKVPMDSGNTVGK